MRYMTYDECVKLGYTPYAVYGGKVYSFVCLGFVIQHDSQDYADALEQLEEMVG